MEFLDFRLPADGFAQPLMLWIASHERSQRVALLVQRLFSHLQQHGPSEATRLTSAEVRRFMNEAAPRHHEDEDRDLFPRLRHRLDGQRDPAVASEEIVVALDRLHGDHDHLDDLWARVRDALQRADQAVPTAQDSAVAGEFVDRFITHHGIEDQIILPAAQLALQPDDLTAIGEAMAARRGTTWSRLASSQRS